MGHRALVAYKQQDERYDAWYTHWGANGLKLTHLISEDSPRGQDYVDQPDEADPVATNKSLAYIATEKLDYLHHEAFYVVDREYDVAPLRTLCPCLFDVYGHHEPETETVGTGFLASVRWYAGEPVGDGWTTGSFDGIKGTVSDLIDQGRLDFDNDQAFQYMYDRFRGDTVWPAVDSTLQLEELVEQAREESPSPGDEHWGEEYV